MIFNCLKWFKKCFLLFFFLFSCFGFSQNTTTETDAQITEDAALASMPNISEIIPLASDLENRLLEIENSVGDIVDVTYIKTEYKKVEDYLKDFKSKFEILKKEDNVGSNELKYLKDELIQEKQVFNDINRPLTNAIEDLEKLRLDWIGEKKKWKRWEKFLLKEDLPSQAKINFKKAEKTIDRALKVLSARLNILLKLQGSGYNSQSIIHDYTSKIAKLHQKKIVNSFEKAAIPMYSSRFYEQFNSKMFNSIQRGFKTIVFPNASFFKKNWWSIIIQILISLSVIILIKKNKKYLRNHKEYKFLADRSVSSGIFFGVLFAFMIYLNESSLQSWNLLLLTIGGMAFFKLFSSFEGPVWIKHFIYAIVILLIITGVFDLISLPIPIFRVYIILLSAFGIYKLTVWNKLVKTTENNSKYYWFFIIASLYLLIVLISEIIGKEVLALFMYESLLRTIIVVVFMVVFMKMIHAGIELGFTKLSGSILRASPQLIADTVKRFSIIVNILIVLFALVPRILVIWGVYESIPVALDSIMKSGLNLGDVNISIGLLITAISVLYGSYILSTVIEMFLMSDTFEKDKLDQGTRLSIAQLIRYFLLFFGFLLAIATLGFNLTNFTIVLSALGVGIGFGLQGVVNNFVSGLILLFERPVREGDTIELQGDWSEIKKIGLRATRVMTFDQSDVIIPNSELVYNQVTNWTLSNRRRRLKMPVGVAYGSNVELVMKLLVDVAKNNEDLLKSYKPVVLFRSFGDSTLNFELRVLAKDALNSIQVESDILAEIDKVFRENNVEIAFPQLDLHVKTVDKSINFNK